jgi:hypothetical protein
MNMVRQAGGEPARARYVAGERAYLVAGAEDNILYGSGIDASAAHERVYDVGA